MLARYDDNIAKINPVPPREEKNTRNTIPHHVDFTPRARKVDRQSLRQAAQNACHPAKSIPKTSLARLDLTTQINVPILVQVIVYHRWIDLTLGPQTYACRLDLEISLPFAMQTIKQSKTPSHNSRKCSPNVVAFEKMSVII